MSKIFEYATDFFEALNRAATTEDVKGKQVRVFRGAIVETYRTLGISQSYYSEVRQGLINSECMTVLRQGSKGIQSVVILHRPPDEDSFESAKGLVLTRQDGAATLSQELDDLKHLIGGIRIPDALVNFEQRITELDNRVTKLEQLLIKQGRR